MYPIKPTIGIEPIDLYEKAKQDILTAFNSVRKLPPAQQEMLAKELFQGIDVAAALSFMQHISGGRI